MGLGSGMRSVFLASVIALLVVGCGGGEANDDGTGATEPTVAGTAAASVAVELTALAFVDTSLGSTLAVSVGPNDAGIDWVDIGLVEDRIASIVMARSDERAALYIEGENFYFTAAGVAASGRLGGSEIVVVTADGASVEQIDASSRRLPSGAPGASRGATEGWEPVGLVSPLRDESVDAQESLEYMVDRPVVVTQSVDVPVSAVVDGAVIDPTTLTGFALLVEGCTAGPSSMGGPPSASCAPASPSRLVVTTEVPLPPADSWKEEHLGIFASRERCEAWATLNGNVGTIVNWLGYGLATKVGSVEPAAGTLMSGVTAALSQVFSATGSVPCGTITVADELIEEFTSANTDVPVALSVSGDSFEYAFDAARIEVYPFAAVQPAPLVLFGTAHEVATPNNDPPTADELAPFDGTYSAALELMEPGDGGRVVASEVTLVVRDSVVVGFDGLQAVEDTPTENGPNGVLCRSDVTFDFSLVAEVQLVDGAGEGSIAYASEQSRGRPTGLSSTFECDPDAEGRQTAVLFVTFAIDGDVAKVDLLAGDRVITTLTLAR